MAKAHNESKALIEKYGQFLFRAVQTREIVIKSADGCYLRDIDGNSYLDMASGVWCAILGHSHPQLSQATSEQISKIIHLGKSFWGLSVLEAAKGLVDVSPEGLSKVIFLNTGSESTECALRIARVATGKNEIVGIERGYYGITLGAQSACGTAKRYKGSFPRVGFHKLLAPYCYRCPVNQTYPSCNLLCLDVSWRLLESNTEGKIAAFIFEPIFCSGGVIVPPRGYFERLEKLARSVGALLVVDEVTTGLGRTGAWFGVEHHQITPDILFLSKTLGAGFPVSAILTTKEVEEECFQNDFYHVQSHMFDPLPAAVAKATIEIVKKENLVHESKRKGEIFQKRFKELQEAHPMIGNIRGKGLLIGVEIVNPKTNSPDSSLGLKIADMCLKSGVFFDFSVWTSVFRILPPLTVSEEQIEKSMEVFEEALQKLTK